jgi:hypothetical protein
MKLESIHEDIKLTVSSELVALEGVRLQNLSTVERFIESKSQRHWIFSNRRTSTKGWVVSASGMAFKIIKNSNGDKRKKHGFAMCGKTIWELNDDVEIISENCTNEDVATGNR